MCRYSKLNLRPKKLFARNLGIIYGERSEKCQETGYLECFLIPHLTFEYYGVSFSNLYVLMYMGISKHALYITDHSWSKRKFWNNLDERSDTFFSLWECNRVIKRFSHSFCNKFRCLNRNMGEKLLIQIHIYLLRQAGAIFSIMTKFEMAKIYMYLQMWNFLTFDQLIMVWRKVRFKSKGLKQIFIYLLIRIFLLYRNQIKHIVN